VNQHKTASSVLIYYSLGQSCLVISIYMELNSGSIQPPFSSQLFLQLVSELTSGVSSSQDFSHDPTETQ